MGKDPRVSVLFLTPTLGIGGAERVLLTLMRSLDRSRFRATLAVLDTAHSELLAALPPDVDMVDLQAGRLRYALPQIWRTIWRVRPAIVFCAFVELNILLVAGRWLLPRGVKLVARETTTLSAALPHRRAPRLWKVVLRTIAPRLDAIVFQSAHTRDDFQRVLNLERINAHLVPNPVDLEAIRGQASEPVALPFDPARIELVAAGRMLPVKGFDLLIEAIGRVGDPRLRLTLLGDGPLVPALKAQAAAAGLEAQVRFAGMIENPYPFYAAASAFVMSSRYEGFPNVVLEALACGAPVISTPLGGVRELLTDVPGCRVANGHGAEDLAVAISAHLREWPTVRPTASAVAAFDAPTVAAQYGQILLGTLDRVQEAVTE